MSSGMGLLGAYKGALEYHLLGRLPRMPAFTGVQQATCDPMARAFAEGADECHDRHLIPAPEGISSATALAGLIAHRARGLVAPDDPVLVNLTGADRPQVPVPQNVIER